MRSRVSTLGVILAAAFSFGCGSELANSALNDSLKDFRTTLEAHRQRGDLSSSDIEEAAHAVAVRELTTHHGDSGVARVDELAPCATHVASALRQVSKRSDDAGAAAVQVLLDEELWSGSKSALRDRFIAHPDAAWRAVGARAATRREDGELRGKAYLDGDLRVRRAALRAAAIASDVTEVNDLLEVARLDPDPVTRRFAIEALGRAAEPRSLSRLRDVWVRANQEDRRAITHAWGQKRAYGNGGEGHLMWVVSTQTGLPQLAAAVILAQNGGIAEQQGIGALVRAIERGTPEEQRYAAAFAPRTEVAVRRALQVMAQDDDEWSAAVAHSALLRVSSTRETARKKLRQLLASEHAEAARQARYALAAIGDRAARSAIVATLRASDPGVRLEAGRLLLWLNDEPTAATVLADPAASVRSRFACAVLAPPPPEAQ